MITSDKFLALLALLVLLVLPSNSQAVSSEFPPAATTEDVPRLLRATSFVRELSESELLALVPLQPGLRYVDCPHCSAGHQENQLVWEPSLGEQVACQYCRHRYPSATYPMNEQLQVTSPSGDRVTFPYWQDASGYRHFFLARRDAERKFYLADRARDLALLYAVTGEEQYARRAVLILNRFAEVFPGWCYHWYAVDWFQVSGGKTHDYFLHGDADRDSSLKTGVPLSPMETLLPAGYSWTATSNEGEAHRVAEPFYAYGFLSQLLTAPLSNATATQLSFETTPSNVNSPITGTQVWLLPESNSQLIVGRNPSIRRANEDDAKLLDFQRPFLALRHQASNGRSDFLTVIEPFQNQPIIESVRKLQVADGALAVEIKTSARTDVIALNALSPITLPDTPQATTYQGEIGILMLQGSTPESSYSLGEDGWRYDGKQLPTLVRRSANLVSINRQSLVVSKLEAAPPRQGSTLRLVTEDHWVYPFTVVSVRDQGDSWSIQVAEPLLLNYDAPKSKLTLLSYPQRAHVGANHCHWESL